MKNSNRQIKIGALLSYFTIFFNLIASLLYTPWMIASIGQNNYGLYTMANSLISMFLVDFGMSAAVVRFIAKYNAERKQEKVNALLGVAYKLYFGIDILISIVLLVLFFLLNTVYANLLPEELQSLKSIYIVVGFYSVLTFPFVTLNGILNAYEEYAIVKICELVNKVLSISLTVMVIIGGGNVLELVLMQAVSGMITILLRFIAVKKKTPVKVEFVLHEKGMLKEILSFSVWNTVVSISQRLIYNIIPSLMGALIGAGEVAIFGVASTIEGYYYTFARAINGFFMPKISRIVQENEKEKLLLNLMIKVGRIQIYILGLVFVAFLSVGSQFVELWMGKEYQPAYVCAVFLILPSFISLPQQIATTALIVMNKVKEQAIANVGTSIISLLLGPFLIIKYGSIGASISICIAYMFRLIWINILYVKELKIDLRRFFKKTFLAQGPYLVAVAIISVLVCSIKREGWAFFLIKSSFVVVLYATVMFFFAFNSDEKKMVRDFINKAMGKIHDSIKK